MRFIICGISHETHTFSRMPANRAAFDVAIGDEIIKRFKNTKTGGGGFIEYCEREGIEFIPTLFAGATPSGKVTTAALEEFLDTILSMIKEAGEIDAVLAGLHGAMVTEEHDDGEGYILKRIRELVGPDIPILATLDMHANISQEMVDYADILVGYDTYPHIDGYERALEAAKLAHKLVKKKIHPAVALEKLPFFPQRQVTHLPPMDEVMRKVFEYEKKDKVLTITMSTGFPWADIPDMGSSVVVTTDNDQRLAEELAKELAEFVWTNRAKFLYTPTSVEDAVERAFQAPEGPVVLADINDNPGGGTACDGTVILNALLKQDAQDVGFGLIADPEAVHEAINSGIGTEVTLQLGGKVDNLHGPTLTLSGTVKFISDGEFIYKGPMGTGRLGELGKAVVLRVKGVDILITEKRQQVLDREIFRRHGITPEDKKILVVKSSNHFRADFEPIAKEIIEVDAPGLLSLDLSRFDYKKIKRPFYPLDTV